MDSVNSSSELHLEKCLSSLRSIVGTLQISVVQQDSQKFTF